MALLKPLPEGPRDTLFQFWVNPSSGVLFRAFYADKIVDFQIENVQKPKQTTSACNVYVWAWIFAKNISTSQSVNRNRLRPCAGVYAKSALEVETEL